MSPGSFHEVCNGASNYVHDPSVEPVIEIEPGECVQLRARDASDEQIRRGSGVHDVTNIEAA